MTKRADLQPGPRAGQEACSPPILLGLESLLPPITGIGRYTSSLLRIYLSRRVTVKGLFLGGLVDRPETFLNRPSREEIPRWRRLLNATPGLATLFQLGRTVLGRWRLRPLVRKGEWLYHEPNYVALPLDLPTVVTVHDLSHLRYPQFHPRERVAFLERYLPGSLARADRIITVSEFSKREIVTLLGIPEAKIAVIPLGKGERFRPLPPERVASILSRWSLRPDGYLAAVGTLEPRKNLLRLLTAYERLPKALRRRYPLVLVGPKGWRLEALSRRFNRLTERGEVRWLGYLPDEVLVALYSGAALFCYPSLYEGFGLPVLEAMACGAPVLTSKGTAMETWAGEGAFYVDPTDPDRLREAMIRLLLDEALNRKLRRQGLRIAQRFSWRDCAERHLRLYRQVIQEGAPGKGLPP